jgi:hypothetical protein
MNSDASSRGTVLATDGKTRKVNGPLGPTDPWSIAEFGGSDSGRFVNDMPALSRVVIEQCALDLIHQAEQFVIVPQKGRQLLSRDDPDHGELLVLLAKTMFYTPSR